MGIVERAGQSSAPHEALRIAEICRVRVLGNNGNRAEHADRFGLALVELKSAGNYRVIAGQRRTNAERRADQTVGAGACTSCGYSGTTRAGADRPGEPAHSAAWGVLDHAGVDAENRRPAFGAQQV